MKVMLKPGTPRSGRKEVIKSVELKGRWGGGGGGQGAPATMLLFSSLPPPNLYSKARIVDCTM